MCSVAKYGMCMCMCHAKWEAKRRFGLFEIVPNISPHFVRANSKCLKSNEKTNLQQSQLASQKFAYTIREYDKRGKKVKCCGSISYQELNINEMVNGFAAMSIRIAN